MEDYESGYIRRVDAVRTVLMAALILSVYRLPLPYTEYFAMLCGFAPCALFTLYGYFVLRPWRYPGARKGDLANTAKVFFVLLGVYVVLGCAYQYLNTGSGTAWLNMPNVLTFLVFNKWPVSVGESIWLVQSVLYALALFVVFRRLSNRPAVALVACAVLMAAGIVFGELAVPLHMPFYIERNFLTTTIPYMLLGKLLWYAPEKLKKAGAGGLLLLFFGGVGLCAAEVLWLRRVGTLDYCQHLIGYLPMTAAVVLFAVRGPRKTDESEIRRSDLRLMTVYRWMYFLYNPVAEFYFLSMILLIGFPTLFNIAASLTAVAAVVLTFLLAKLVAKLRWR